jgi:hypothetical protein
LSMFVDRYDQVVLFYPVQGTEGDVPGFSWERRSNDARQYEHPKVTSTVLGKPSSIRNAHAW